MTEAPDRELALSEPPRVRADPAEVAHRIAEMADLPVEHAGDSLGSDHQVAVAEVVVHDPVFDLVRQVVEQPTGGEVDHGLRRVELLVGVPHRVHELLRCDRLEVFG